MINKTDNKKRINTAIKISEKYALDGMTRELKDLQLVNEKYRIHILLVGSFNAGKSALLNKLIGRAVLTENQAPETAIATELYYSQNEKIVANCINGQKYIIKSIDNINVDEVRNIEYYLNCDSLKEENDYIIVDTPGFDSGIEKHNKALMQYVDNGTAYILVVDCEKGTISESALNFVNEVSNYSGDIAIIINKCDKRITEEVDEIKEHIEDLLLASCGREFSVVCTSKKDADAKAKILNLIHTFKSQYLYEKNFTKILNIKRDSLIGALELIKNNKECDTVEIDEEIQKREIAKRHLLEQMEMQRKRMKIKLHSDVKKNIINNINSQLMCNAPALANDYKGGVELFQKSVIEIIRPIMIKEVENYSSTAYGDLVKHLNFDSLENKSNIEEISNVIVSVYDKLKSLGETKNLMVDMKNTNKNKMTKNRTRPHRTVSSILSIATDLVIPSIELIMVFLSDIVEMLNAFLGTSKDQQLVEAIQNKIIPQIVSKLEIELDKSLDQVEAVMIDNIDNNINEIIDIENKALKIAKDKKNNMQKNHSGFLSEIEEDIIMLRK